MVCPSRKRRERLNQATVRRLRHSCGKRGTAGLSHKGFCAHRHLLSPVPGSGSGHWDKKQMGLEATTVPSPLLPAPALTTQPCTVQMQGCHQSGCLNTGSRSGDDTWVPHDHPCLGHLPRWGLHEEMKKSFKGPQRAEMWGSPTNPSPCPPESDSSSSAACTRGVRLPPASPLISLREPSRPERPKGQFQQGNLQNQQWFKTNKKSNQTPQECRLFPHLPFGPVFLANSFQEGKTLPTPAVSALPRLLGHWWCYPLQYGISSNVYSNVYLQRMTKALCEHSKKMLAYLQHLASAPGECKLSGTVPPISIIYYIFAIKWMKGKASHYPF